MRVASPGAETRRQILQGGSADHLHYQQTHNILNFPGIFGHSFLMPRGEPILITRVPAARWRKIALDSMPVAGGAYALLVELKRPARLPIARLGCPRLGVGRYVYCGSAYGPGGLAARLKRHLAASKTVQWHIDYLTRRGRVAEVWARSGGQECDIVEGLLARQGTRVPIHGFGSSDCRRCHSHLLAVSEDFTLNGLSGWRAAPNI